MWIGETYDDSLKGVIYCRFHQSFWTLCLSADHRRKCMESYTLSSKRINGIVWTNESKTITLAWVKFFCLVLFQTKTDSSLHICASVVSIKTWFNWQKADYYSFSLNVWVKADSGNQGILCRDLFLEIPHSFRTRKAKAKSETFQLQSCFIHLFLIWRKVLFTQNVLGRRAPGFRRINLLVVRYRLIKKLLCGPEKFPGLSRNGPQVC